MRPIKQRKKIKSMYMFAPSQEVVEDESEQLQEIPAVETENASSSVTENEVNQTAEKNQVDVHVCA